MLLTLSEEAGDGARSASGRELDRVDLLIGEVEGQSGLKEAVLGKKCGGHET